MKRLIRLYYPSTSVTGEPVVLSSLLCCWAPTAPATGDAIESVHIYSRKGIYIKNHQKVIMK